MLEQLEELEYITLNNKELSLKDLNEFIKVYCPNRVYETVYKKLKEHKQANFTFISPDKSLELANIKIIKRSEEVVKKEG